MTTKVPEYLKERDINPDFNHKKELEYWLEKFDIEKEEICIYGSVPLHIAGIRENRDLDVLTTTEIKKRILPKVKNHPNCQVRTDQQRNLIICFGNNIHTGPISSDRFDYFGLSNKELIEQEKYHMIVNGYKIFRLELTFSKKVTEKRKKDLKDIEKIERSHFFDASSWNWDLVYSLPPWEMPKKGSSWKPLHRRVGDALENENLRNFFKSELKYLFKTLESIDIFENLFVSTEKFSKIKNFCRFKNHHHFLQLKFPIPVILSNYFEKNKYYGWDIILKYAVKSDNFPSDLNSREKIMYNSKLEQDNQIIISREGRILEGQSLIVDKIYNGDYIVEIEIKDNSINIDKDKNWLQKIKINEDQKDFVEKKSLEFFEKSGLIFYAIIWPPAQNIFEEIEKYVQNRVQVIDSELYDISHDFSNIIHKFYEKDERAKKWKIDKKINEMKQKDKIIKVLKLWLPNPEFRDYYKNDFHSDITRNLKNDCRKKFHKKIENYTWDNLIHTTETYESNHQTFKVLDTHCYKV